jgi:phage terminase large subunit-like protein
MPNLPYAVQVNVNNVSMLVGDWNAAYREELRAFPYGRFDDQVARSGARLAKDPQRAFRGHRRRVYKSSNK